MAERSLAVIQRYCISTLISFRRRRLVLISFIAIWLAQSFTLYIFYASDWQLISIISLILALGWLLIDILLRLRGDYLGKLPDRPEFYDFDLLNQAMHAHELSDDVSLKQLTYVVFDTETTGLRPSDGDEIISIAGVKIRDGQVQEKEIFTALVNPKRAIPKASFRFHGITDTMVRDQPEIEAVLPAFQEFVGDSILVAHNAAFDMKFLKLKEQSSGVIWHHMVFDTLLLSVFLDPETRDHTLDGIAARCGVHVHDRHTALGDSLVTAHVFNHLLDMLESRGIKSIFQAVKAQNSMIDVRKKQKEAF